MIVRDVTLREPQQNHPHQYGTCKPRKANSVTMKAPPHTAFACGPRLGAKQRLHPSA